VTREEYLRAFNQGAIAMRRTPEPINPYLLIEPDAERALAWEEGAKRERERPAVQKLTREL